MVNLNWTFLEFSSLQFPQRANSPRFLDHFLAVKETYPPRQLDPTSCSRQLLALVSGHSIDGSSVLGFGLGPTFPLCCAGQEPLFSPYVHTIIALEDRVSFPSLRLPPHFTSTPSLQDHMLTSKPLENYTGYRSKQAIV